MDAPAIDSASDEDIYSGFHPALLRAAGFEVPNKPDKPDTQDEQPLERILLPKALPIAYSKKSRGQIIQNTAASFAAGAFLGSLGAYKVHTGGNAPWQLGSLECLTLGTFFGIWGFLSAKKDTPSSWYNTGAKDLEKLTQSPLIPIINQTSKITILQGWQSTYPTAAHFAYDLKHTGKTLKTLRGVFDRVNDHADADPDLQLACEAEKEKIDKLSARITLVRQLIRTQYSYLEGNEYDESTLNEQLETSRYNMQVLENFLNYRTNGS